MTKEVFIALIQKDIRELDMIAQGLYETELPSPTIIKLATSKAHDVITNLQLLAEVKGISENEPQHSETTTPHNSNKKGAKKAKAVKETPAEKASTPIAEEKPIQVKPDIEINIQPEPLPAPVAEIKAEPVNIRVDEQKPVPVLENEKQTIATPPAPPVVEATPEEKPAPVEEVKKEPEVPVEVEPMPAVQQEPRQEASTQKAGNLFNALSSQKTPSLRKSISIGNRFMFQRELFGNNADKMNQTIDFIDNCSSLKEAEKYLSDNFQWDAEKESVIEFFNLLNRKFV